MSRRSLLQFAARHHGLLRLVDAERHELSRAQLDRMCYQGVLELLGGNVWRVQGSPASWHQAVLAACWRAGPAAQASHRTASALRDFHDAHRRIVEVLVPFDHGSRTKGVVVHRTRHLRGADLGFVGVIPVTSVERTVIDMASIGPPRRTEQILDDAVHKGLTTSRRVADHLGSMPTRGRTGAKHLWELLAERTGDPDERANAWENRMSRLIARAGLPTPVRQHKVVIGADTFYLDFAFPEQMVAVECDSVEAHSTGPQLRYDLDRQHAIEDLGWCFKRFVPSHAKDDPRGIQSRIRETLVSRGWTANE